MINSIKCKIKRWCTELSKYPSELEEDITMWIKIQLLFPSSRFSTFF